MYSKYKDYAEAGLLDEKGIPKTKPSKANPESGILGEKYRFPKHEKDKEESGSVIKDWVDGQVSLGRKWHAIQVSPARMARKIVPLKAPSGIEQGLLSSHLSAARAKYEEKTSGLTNAQIPPRPRLDASPVKL